MSAAADATPGSVADLIGHDVVQAMIEVALRPETADRLLDVLDQKQHAQTT